jgi:hypothetical protein
MANRYWVGGSGSWNTSTTHWSTSSGGASGASAPTSADSVFFDQAATYTVSLTSALNKCLDLTVSAGTVTITGGAGVSSYGSFTLKAGTIWSAAGTIAFSSTATGRNITTNGVTLASSQVIFNGVGGSWALSDNFTSKDVYFQNGTLNLNGKTLTTTATIWILTGTKNITFNGGTIVCTAVNNTDPAGFTTTAGTGTGTISMNSATATGFTGGGSTWNCTVSNDSGNTLTFYDSNTITTLTNTVRPTTFTFTAGTTQTVTNFSVSGTSGNLVTINSDTSGTAATLSKASGTVNASYLSLKDSTATGGATWNATNSTNVSGNTGWNFLIPATSNFFALF